MKKKVVSITLTEGGRMIFLPPWRHGLTKSMVMSLPKKDRLRQGQNYPSVTWGGWIHSFWCCTDNGLTRYDAVND